MSSPTQSTSGGLHQKSPIETTESESTPTVNISQADTSSTKEYNTSWSGTIPPLLPGVPESLIAKYANEPDPYVRNALINEEFSLAQHQQQGVGNWIWTSLDTIGSYMDYFGGIIASWIGLRDSKYQDVIESLEWEKFENEQLDKSNQTSSTPSSSLTGKENDPDPENISLNHPHSDSSSSNSAEDHDWQATPVSVPSEAETTDSTQSIVPISSD